MGRILVTGGSGNVGRFVIAELAQAHEVVSFDRRPPGEPSGVAFIEGDIMSLDDLREAMVGIDAVVHLAAIPNPNNDPPDHVFEVNVVGTHRVAESAAEAGVQRIILASSDSTLGFVFGSDEQRPEYLPIDEEHPLRPSDPYGLSKLVGEETLASHSRAFGMTTVALRYCWVWFPPEYPDTNALSANLDIARRTLAGYVDARDVAQAVRLAIDTPLCGHEAFMISAADTYLTIPTLEFLAQALPALPELRDPGRYMGNPYTSLFCWDKARRLLGYSPQHTWRR